MKVNGRLCCFPSFSVISIGIEIRTLDPHDCVNTQSPSLPGQRRSVRYQAKATRGNVSLSKRVDNALSAAGGLVSEPLFPILLLDLKMFH